MVAFQVPFAGITENNVTGAYLTMFEILYSIITDIRLEPHYEV